MVKCCDFKCVLFKSDYAWSLGRLKMVKCRALKMFFCFESVYVWGHDRLKMVKCRDFIGAFLF